MLCYSEGSLGIFLVTKYRRSKLDRIISPFCENKECPCYIGVDGSELAMEIDVEGRKELRHRVISLDAFGCTRSHCSVCYEKNKKPVSP